MEYAAMHMQYNIEAHKTCTRCKLLSSLWGFNASFHPAPRRSACILELPPSIYA